MKVVTLLLASLMVLASCSSIEEVTPAPQNNVTKEPVEALITINSVNGSDYGNYFLKLDLPNGTIRVVPWERIFNDEEKAFFERLQLYEDFIVFRRVAEAYADLHHYNDFYNCVNYSADFASLDILRRLGIEVEIKTGYESPGEGHAWNFVCFDWESQDASFARYSEAYPYAYNPYWEYSVFGNKSYSGRRGI